jgi:hypothetical protein
MRPETLLAFNRILWLCIAGAILGSVVVVIDKDRKHDREYNENRLEHCLNQTERTDFECDSCYHAIYGQENKNCGLCE